MQITEMKSMEPCMQLTEMRSTELSSEEGIIIAVW